MNRYVRGFTEFGRLAIPLQTAGGVLPYLLLGQFLLLAGCDSGAATSPPVESGEQALTVEVPSSASSGTTQKSNATSHGDLGSSSLHQPISSAEQEKVLKSLPRDLPIGRFITPAETGKYNVLKQKGGKEDPVTAAPAPARVAKTDYAEIRNRYERYLAQWEREKDQHHNLSPDEQEKVKGQLKRSIVGD